jgi:nitroreductase
MRRIEMDAFVAVVSKREVRSYDPRPIPDNLLIRVLEAGRATGSSRNRQPWRFVLVTERARLRDLAPSVSQPGNVAGCTAAVAIVLTNPRATFDGGRAAQNMMLAAWNDGIGSCPNTVMDDAAAKQVLKVPEEMAFGIILSFGYPAPGAPHPRPQADPTRVLARIDRLPLAEVAYKETYGSAFVEGGQTRSRSRAR